MKLLLGSTKRKAVGRDGRLFDRRYEQECGKLVGRMVAAFISPTPGDPWAFFHAAKKLMREHGK